MMKKILFLFFCLFLVGCGQKTKKLETPHVFLIDNIAYWQEVANASGYNVEINGDVTFVNSDVTSIELKAMDVIRVQAVSNNKKFENSLFSNEIKYDPFANVTTYRVEWVVDGTVVELDDKVVEGTIPSYDGATPTKPSTDKYSYEFIGWDKEIVEVNSNIIYTAVFKEILNEYTITFYDEEGQVVLSRVTVAYGEDAKFDKEIPTKDFNDGVKYEFNNWVTTKGGSIIDDLSNVTSNRNVYASYKRIVQTINLYIVTNNSYGTVSTNKLDNIELGSKITVYQNNIFINNEIVTATPLADDDQYIYSFDGWVVDDEVKNGSFVVANFSRKLKTYEVTWMNDSVILEVDKDVEYGVIPTYNGEIPISNNSTLVFAGWTPIVEPVKCNVIYKAKFVDIIDSNVVKFYDDDCVTVLAQIVVKNGETAVYPYGNPVKKGDAQYAYSFEKWVTDTTSNEEANLSNITTNKNFYAKYNSEIKEYTVVFNDYDGTELKTEIVKYGQSAIAPEDPYRDDYKFIGWSVDYSKVEGDLTIFALYSQEYIITLLNNDNTIFDYIFVEHGSLATKPSKNPSSSTGMFVGWCIEGTEQLFDFDNKKVFENITLKAHFKNQYKVTFYDFNGNILKEEYVLEGESATAPEGKDYNEYKFVGWDKDYTNCLSDLNINAKYELKKYEVNFYMPDGTLINDAPIFVEAGFSAIAPIYPDYYYDSKSYKVYKFTRWDKEFNNVDKSMNVYAIYEDLYDIPAIIVKFNKETNKPSIILSYDSTKNIYGLEFTIDYSSKGNKISIEDLKLKTKELKSAQYILNNNEKNIKFAWASFGSQINECYTTIFEEINIELDGNIEINETTFKILSNCKTIIDGNNGLINIQPLIIYCWN